MTIHLILFYTLLFSVVFLSATAVILFRNLLTFNRIHDGLVSPAGSARPKVSILVPARNEAGVIGRCISSCLKQSYHPVEIVVLDDQSEDETPSILRQMTENESRLRVLQGKGPAEGWLGKPRACQQLGEAADGEVLIFIDADVWLETTAVTRIVNNLYRDNLDALTVWPQQRLVGFWEKVVVPLVYFTLTTMLPADYVRRDPRWIPPVFRAYFKTAFAAACGQCIAFRKDVYTAIGGHSAVKDRVVEDVELAKTLKKQGFTIGMYRGNHQVHCRMYTNHHEIRQGFRKNFLAGFGNNLGLFCAAALLHIVVFILPFAGFIIALMHGNEALLLVSFTAIILVHLQRLAVDLSNGWNPVYGLLHMLGVLWFQRLGITVLSDYIMRRNVSWKGRNIQPK
ncbi:MAG: chlorobactene glucosyltransferase CruC [Bacteroidetes bacterium HLUCCA01]|nr:MAG: chlorobactene glucosyltransferase CruC [Bacteroidetes bacterium HLUCCA01]